MTDLVSSIDPHCFSGQMAPVIKCFVIPPNTNLELRRNRLLDAGRLTNLPRFQGARPDHVRVESFVRPRELLCFDLRHVTPFPSSNRKTYLSWGGGGRGV